MKQEDISLIKLIKNGHIGVLISPHSLHSLDVFLNLEEETVYDSKYHSSENCEIYSTNKRITKIVITFDQDQPTPVWVESTKSIWYKRLINMSIEELKEFSIRNNLDYRLVYYCDNTNSIIFPDCGLCIIF